MPVLVFLGLRLRKGFDMTKHFDCKENPYPNEHSARLKRPSGYKRFRRQNDRFGKGVHAIWGITFDGYSELQSIRFDSSQFTAAQSKAWMKNTGYKALKFEPAKKFKKNPAEDYLNVGEYVTVGKAMNLFFGATTRSPATHFYTYHPGYLLQYQSTAPNGMVWFIDVKRNERGYTESGDTKNLLKDGRILRKYKKNPVSYLDVWNDIETPSKVELVRVIRELKGEELPDKDIIKSMHSAGIDKGFAEWIMTSFVWR